MGRNGLLRPRSPTAPSWGGRTQPCTCKNPLAARAGARSPGARGSPVGTVGAGRGEGRTRCSLSAAPLPRPQGLFFFFPQSRQHPPANIRARLKAAYGLDRTHSVLWMRPPCREDQPGWMQGQRGGRTPHLLPRCSAPLRIRLGGGRWANKAPSAHHAPGTTVALDPSPSCPGLPMPGAAQKHPVGTLEPSWSRQVPAAPAGTMSTPHRGRCPPACVYVPGREAMPALALAGGAAASGGAGSAPRPPPRVMGGRGKQRTCQLLWKTAGRKAALFAAPGSGASAAWARASRHSPPRGGSTGGREWPGVAQVG